MTLLLLFGILLASDVLIRKFLLGINVSSKPFVFFKRYFPWIEMITWTVFLIWAVNIWFYNSGFLITLNMIIAILIFIVIAWFILKDYVAGVIIKSRYNLAKGQGIKANNARGTIKKVGFLALEISSDSGSDLKLPYFQIDQKSIEFNFQENKSGEYKLNVEIRKDRTESEFAEEAIELIINSPWSSHKTRPTITMVDENSKCCTYEIQYRTNGKDHSEKLKSLIAKRFRAS